MKASTMKVLFSIFLMGLVSPLFSQHQVEEIVVKDAEISLVNSDLSISFQIDLSNYDIQTNEMVVFTPVIQSQSVASERIAFSSVVVTGKLRHKVMHRKIKFEQKNDPQLKSMTLFKMSEMDKQAIRSNYFVKHQPWMDDASLMVAISVFGCADCIRTERELLVASRLLPERELQPELSSLPYKVTFIEPSVEKTGEKLGDATKPRTVEDVWTIIRESSKDLSLYSLLSVAEKYPAGSDDFNAIHEVIRALYPDNDIAIVNCAANEIVNQNPAKAIELLMKIAENPKSWNNLGVAHMLNDDLEKAEQYFHRSAENGDPDAIENLENLRKIVR